MEAQERKQILEIGVSVPLFGDSFFIVRGGDER